MNTVSKGDAFEARSYDLIKEAIDNLRLGVIPENCRIKKKPKYYSKDRESDIVFDISIEVWMEGAPNYSFLFVIECKDYHSKVSIDNLEEFKNKVSQVSRTAKLIFITTNELQKGAKVYAKNNSIMVIQVDEQNIGNILLYNSKQTTSLQNDTSFINLQKELQELAEIQSFIFSDTNNKDFNWDNLIEKFLKHALAGNLTEKASSQTPIVGLERLSQKRIEEMTCRILDDFDPNILKYHLIPCVETFIEYLSNKHEIKVITDKTIPEQKGRKINGLIDIKKKTITIDKDVAASSQFAFVLFHEVAHFFLHSSVQFIQEIYDGLTDSAYNAEIGKHELVNERHWLEWQANQFAASLLMPQWSLMYNLILYQTKEYIRNKGRIYVDNAPHNIQLFRLTIYELSNKFGVSTSVMEYRLADLGIITYAGGQKRPSTAFTGKLHSTKTFSQIFKKMAFTFTESGLDI